MLVDQFVDPDRFISETPIRSTTGDGRDLFIFSGTVRLPPEEKEQKDTSEWRNFFVWLRLDSYTAFYPDGLIPTAGRKYVVVEEPATLVTVSSFYNKGRSVNSGFAVERAWTLPTTFPVRFIDVIARCGVRDKDAELRKIGYQVTILGRTVELTSAQMQEEPSPETAHLEVERPIRRWSGLPA